MIKFAIMVFLTFTHERAIFQTFWRIHSCAKFLSFELETSNFGSSYVFSSPLKWRGWFLPNLTFWTQKWHISGKMYRYAKTLVSWVKDVKLWLQPCLFEPEKLLGSDFTQLNILNSKMAYFSILRVKSRYQSLTQETNFWA